MGDKCGDSVASCGSARRRGAAEPGVAVQLLASLPNAATKFPLMPASRLFVLLFLLFAVLAQARNQPQSCGLATGCNKPNFLVTLRSKSIPWVARLSPRAAHYMACGRG